MSWWDINNDSVIGDEPADLLVMSLSAIGRDRRSQGRPRPTVQEIMDGLAVALRATAKENLDDGGRISIRRLVCEQAPGPAVVSDDAGGVVDETIVAELRDSLEAIKRVYEERWQRKPRLGEFLETLTFVIGYEPERFMSFPEGAQEIQRVLAE